MSKLKSPFDYKKATQALNYFAVKAGGKINKMKALKLVYFADRYHLRKYGRLITKDNYVAMEHGPVASATRDILEKNLFADENDINYINRYIEPAERFYKSLNAIDEDKFSESDREALKFAWENFGNLDQFKLRDLTHKYPEWKSRKHILAKKLSAAMDINEFFDDPEDRINKCFELSAQDKKDRKEYFNELICIESIWS